MKNKIIILSLAFLLTAKLFAQSELEKFLSEVEQNSLSINAQSYKSVAEYNRTKSELSMGSPEIGFGYFPSARGDGDIKKTVETYNRCSA